MPDEVRAKLKGLQLDNSAVDTLLDEMVAGKFIQAVLNNADSKTSKLIANWLTSVVQALVAEGEITWDKAVLDVEQFLKLATHVLDNKVSSTNAKVAIGSIVVAGGDPVAFLEKNDLLQVSDEGAIKSIVQQVIDENPEAANDVQQGQDKAIGFLVGQVMKLSKGQADPQLSQKLIRELINGRG